MCCANMTSASLCSWLPGAAPADVDAEALDSDCPVADWVLLHPAETANANTAPALTITAFFHIAIVFPFLITFTYTPYGYTMAR
jgi:hypothetical protein